MHFAPISSLLYLSVSVSVSLYLCLYLLPLSVSESVNVPALNSTVFAFANFNERSCIKITSSVGQWPAKTRPAGKFGGKWNTGDVENWWKNCAKNDKLKKK